MPSKTERQKVAMAIALHHPEKLLARNRGLLGMKQGILAEFAAKPLSNAIQKRKARKTS